MRTSKQVSEQSYPCDIPRCTTLHDCSSRRRSSLNDEIDRAETIPQKKTGFFETKKKSLGRSKIGGPELQLRSLSALAICSLKLLIMVCNANQAYSNRSPFTLPNHRYTKLTSHCNCFRFPCKVARWLECKWLYQQEYSYIQTATSIGLGGKRLTGA